MDFSSSVALTSLPSNAVCFVVLITRRLFEEQSETHEASIPKIAERTNERKRSSEADTSGIFSLKKLYVKNQGKCLRCEAGKGIVRKTIIPIDVSVWAGRETYPTAVAAAWATAPR